ncbi:2-succinyl-5-enolpyruvyl-6-hydroxy-3-cyclohexene-1-carboxylic-acid synthase [Jeotgalibacillus soli]|uniref:2-succinyl-5-enolpyruvyl-6-hydroxy-3-cyclohexene-1-carboxylate synthase n=1 Tax=Jeotgalibacillus soli TaxID=889306 RepID=A0A0C2VHI4_9BACL|nr:2-succinyl-5-enolpyruvyl-6-hydroxy-3-cyclohexene-1-carboxylic-acid synthase [Jeotgalibacillus soli]KIL43951.1 2-succinyl-5-enolpyruvyl-6-hydroxy-3-cyclohexene-1-carboxylate synthase [Jeotgalibacillus soli]
MSHQQTLTTFVATFVQQLHKGGVKRAVISPGSRSTPLAYVLQEHPLIECHVNVDERSAAFYALGMAKKTGEPVVLLCTSGTAAANYYPAVVEARYARIPLLVLTADRPHELREVGAPQAIDQIHLFGHHVKWFADMALPEDSNAVLNYVRRIATRAIAKSLEAPYGPVHLNFPFREPLIPDLDGAFEELQEVRTISLYRGEKAISKDQARELAVTVNSSEKGIIVVGPMDSPHVKDELIQFAKRTGYPVLVDPLSHLRSALKEESLLIESYDAFLRLKDLINRLKPDLIIRFGGMPVSKPLTQFLQAHKAAEHWLVDKGTEWRDPISTVTSYIESDDAAFINGLLPFLKDRTYGSWQSFWQDINAVTVHEIGQYVMNERDEGAIVGRILRQLPVGSQLVVGNSMPIRDVDTFWTREASSLSIWANRGANGIDGVVSTALGISSVSEEPVYLLIGDLSFFHDLNGLLVSKQHANNLRIIVLNNNGGGIFSYLPQSSEPKHFETLFGTPTELDFEHAARLYGASYERVIDPEQLDAALQAQSEVRGVSIIEVMTNRDENVLTHRSLWRSVQSAVERKIGGE